MPLDTTNGQQAPVYYPSVMCRFRLRFDEALHIKPGDQTTGAPVPQSPANPSATLSLSSDTAIQNGQLPALLQGKADQLSQIIDVMPLRASIALNGYRQTGTFTLELLYRDFPIEPDVMRAIGVEIYAGSIAPAAWGAGNTQAQPPGGAATLGFGQSPRSSQIDTSNEDNLLLIGLVDEHETEFTDKGFLVRLKGRDLIGVMLDLHVTPAMLEHSPRLNSNLPITEVVQQIIKKVPLLSTVTQSSGGALTVMTQLDEWPGGVVPSPGIAGDWNRVNLGAVVQPNPQQQQTAPQILPTNINRQKVWDLITAECQLVGAVPYFKGRTLWLRPAVALYDPHKPVSDPTRPTPFAEGKPRTISAAGGSDYQITIRNLAFGRDIVSLKRSRKLGGIKVRQIHVVSVDTSSKQRGPARKIEAWWPKVNDVGQQTTTAALTTSVAPSGMMAQTDVVTVSFPGIRNPARLLEIAKSIYEEVGRGEVGGSCSTKDLASLGGDGADPDMLRLRPGDPVQFSVDNRQLQSYPPPISEAASTYRSTAEQLASDLEKRLGDVNLARVLAYSLKGMIVERQPIYRVNHVRFSWDINKGIGIDFDFQNYIESRSGITTLTTTANKRRPVSTKG